MFLLRQASLRAVRKGNNCLTTAKIHLFSETRNFSPCFFAFWPRNTVFLTEGRRDRKGPRSSSYRGTREPDSSLTS